MHDLDAIRQALARCHALRYIPEAPDDRWQTPDETLRAGGGDCEDHALLCLATIHALVDPPPPTLRMVVGDVPGGRHAWVEVERGRRILWCDPTPGAPDAIEAPGWWSTRTPLYAYPYDGQVLGKGLAYVRRDD